MCKKEIVKKFNNITAELLYDMTDVVGTSYYYKFKLLIRVNSVYPINKFKLNVIKFKDIILSKNANFFYNENIIKKQLDGFSGEDYEYYMNEYHYLRNIYNGIDEDSKDNLWDILKVLIFLCESYHFK